jgi:O-antigen/teichoic acid export membrane protein
MNLLTTTALTVALRLATMASKAVLVVYLGRAMGPEDLGTYGLMAGAVGFTAYLVGAEFSLFSSREILRVAAEERLAMLRSQAAFHLVAYAVIGPLCLAVFTFGLLPWHLAGWFYALAIVEHLSLELHRLFVTLSRPIVANAVLFVRGGVWVYALALVVACSEGALELNWVWAAWATSGLIAVICAGTLLAFNLTGRATTASAVDWRWIRKGLVASLPFFLSAMAFRLIEVTDRFVLQHFLGEAKVGVYVLYAQLASVVQAFVSGLELAFYPRIIGAYIQGQSDRYLEQLRKFAFAAIVSAGAVALLMAFLILPIVDWFPNPVYGENLGAYWILLATTLLSTCVTLTYYPLYVRHKDGMILRGVLLGSGANIAANVTLVPVYGLTGAAVSAATGWLVILGSYLYAIRR